ncbi:MAG: amino acid carrier protein [Candidatus Aminicenantes bacterium]|nr:amino acid carrier protein [Candidatus Aminicenantes bacterium]NIM81522.1 amino acid carrier protein [Candidatus Aminicenantes bacterium]NIN20893.1 amino acid carrier protein [Candidatus Aminicenantes bacterium]NIN44714.1 amino acid carrier protein [Candidatus Aminicenantes bacterium]NIN87522.1 amino acid carrier protein [Candidatus Aminicenantes bacterium]
MEEIVKFIDNIFVKYYEYVGGYLLLILLVPTGIYFAFKFRFLHVTKLGHALQVISGKYDKKEDTGDINHFRALTTALSATVGTGNIVGVALAIYYGGPGAIFWMWVTGFLGMVLKFVECTLSFKFRKVHEDGSISGGPMYYMEMGLKKKLGSFSKVMAVVFATATILCSLGTGNMAQSNSISDVLKTNYNIPVLITGAAVTFVVLLVIVGGIKRIAEVTSKLVPFMAFFYFVSAVTIILVFIDKVPGTFLLIFKSAFTGTAVVGGFIGSVFIITLRYGVARGLFSNEAGQGSAAIAHAAAKTEHPVREGLVASVGPLVDTLIICTLTALVIILTGAWDCGIEGVGMTVEGFSRGLSRIGLENFAGHVVAGGLLLFAFSTIISWSYYGTRGAEYLFGEKFVKPYRYIYGLFVFLGAIGEIEIVWHFVDMVITFMTIPNLIAIILLAPIVKQETEKYFDYMKRQQPNNY